MWCCLFACLIHVHFLPHNDLIKTTYTKRCTSFCFLSVLIFILVLFNFTIIVRRIALYGRLNRTSIEMKRKSFKYTHESMITWRKFLLCRTTEFFIFHGTVFFLILLMEMANIYMSNFCGLKEIFFSVCIFRMRYCKSFKVLDGNSSVYRQDVDDERSRIYMHK